MRTMNVNKIYDFVIWKIPCMVLCKLDFIMKQKCPKLLVNVFHIGFMQICETVHETHDKLHLWPYVDKFAENQN
jgi:hypothetical protein